MSYSYPQIISILRQHSDSEHLKTPILLSSLSSVPRFFPALSILLALQKRTKKSRSMSNTNKDHIFSTRLHPVNCEPEGKVQNVWEGGRGAVSKGASHSWQPRASLSRQEYIADQQNHTHHKVGWRHISCYVKVLFCFTYQYYYRHPESSRSATSSNIVTET